MEPPLVGAEGYDKASESGSEVGSLVGFNPGWAPRKESCSGNPSHCITLVKLTEASRYLFHESCCFPCL